MKVYFIGNGYDGCYYVRCLLPLVANGWHGTKTSISGTKATHGEAFRGAMDADVVVFQRPDSKAKVDVVPLLQKAGKIVVFDNDDTYRPDCGVPNLMAHKDTVTEMNDNLMEFVRRADIVTTTTDFLADEYKQFNNNVHVLPNCIDPDDWDEPLRNEADKVRIGLVGSVTLNEDSKEIRDVLEQLSVRKDVEIVVFGLPPDDKKFEMMQKTHAKEIAFWKSLNIDWQPLVGFPAYFEILNELRLDIMLIPRADTYFNRCKSNLKYLEASMLEIPVIAQSFKDKNSPYDKDIEHGLNGYLVETGGDWMTIIDKLVSDKQKREMVGKHAKQYVLDNYSIQSHSHKWKELYETACNNKR